MFYAIIKNGHITRVVRDEKHSEADFYRVKAKNDQLGGPYEYELITGRMAILAEYAERKQAEAEATKQVVHLVHEIQVTASEIERQLGVDDD